MNTKNTKGLIAIFTALFLQLLICEAEAARSGVGFRETQQPVNVFPISTARGRQQIDHGHPTALPAGSIFSTSQPAPNAQGPHYGNAYGGIVVGHSRSRLIYAPNWSQRQVQQFNAQKYVFLMKYFAASQMVQPNYVRKKIRTRSRHRTRYRLEAGLDLPLPRISIPRVNLPSLKKSGHFELALKIDGKAKKEVSTNDQDTTATPDTSKTPASETPVENPTETPVETPTETPEDKTPAADAEQPTLKKTEPGDKTPDDQKPVEQETVQKDQGNTDEKTETPVETPAETPAENPAEKTDDKPEDKKPAGEAEKKDSTDTNADVKSTETEWISPIENADCNLDDRRFGCYQDPKAMKKNGKLVAKFRLHKGWDLKTSRQSKAVVAPTDCKIEKVVHNTSPTSYGNQMFLLCEGYQVIFSHLKSFIKTSGDVKRGEKIANSGQTGYTTGYNLEIGLKKDGKLVDPSTKFKESSICKSADPIDPTFEKQPASTCSSGAKDGSGESTEENTKVQTPVEQDSEKLISTSKAAS